MRCMHNSHAFHALGETPTSRLEPPEFSRPAGYLNHRESEAQDQTIRMVAGRSTFLRFKSPSQTGWNIAPGGSNVAPTAAVEATLTEKRLKREAGRATCCFARERLDPFRGIRHLGAAKRISEPLADLFRRQIFLVCGDRPCLLEWIGDASRAVSVELIPDGQQDSCAEGHSPLDHRVGIGDVKVNE
jgi:hypothetical protein